MYTHNWKTTQKLVQGEWKSMQNTKMKIKWKQEWVSECFCFEWFNLSIEWGNIGWVLHGPSFVVWLFDSLVYFLYRFLVSRVRSPPSSSSMDHDRCIYSNQYISCCARIIDWSIAIRHFLYEITRRQTQTQTQTNSWL